MVRLSSSKSVLWKNGRVRKSFAFLIGLNDQPIMQILKRSSKEISKLSKNIFLSSKNVKKVKSHLAAHGQTKKKILIKVLKTKKKGLNPSLSFFDFQCYFSIAILFSCVRPIPGNHERGGFCCAFYSLPFSVTDTGCWSTSQEHRFQSLASSSSMIF